jgi:hypothetical protein
MGDNVLSSISGDVLGAAARELPEAQPTGPATQRLVVRLPDGKSACVTFSRRESKRGKTTRWFWTAERADLLPDDQRRT